MLQKLLRRKAVQADLAEDGVAALERVASRIAAEPYHLVFMDNLMPVMVSHIILQSCSNTNK